MEETVIHLVQQYTWVATVVMVIGVLRVMNKPLFSLLHAIVPLTPSPKDDELLDTVEKSTVMKWITYALDWFGSIKLEKPKA